jgi:hypothetical protein
MDNDDLKNPRLRTMITIYEVDHGWRYRVGWRDDGNYGSASEALFCAENWMKHNPGAKVDASESGARTA